MFAVLASILASSLAAPFSNLVYVTDASNVKGGVCATTVPGQLAEVLWRSADRVGKNLPLVSSWQAVLSAHDELHEHEPVEEEAVPNTLCVPSA